MREGSDLCFGFDIEEQRELYAEQSEINIIKYDDPPELTKEQLLNMGFSKSTKTKVYRPGRATKGSAKQVTIKNQKYPSMTIASKETGIAYHSLLKFANGLITEKELLERQTKRIIRLQANLAFRESEEKIGRLREN